jgi:hypothetical protein
MQINNNLVTHLTPVVMSLVIFRHLGLFTIIGTSEDTAEISPTVIS